MKDKIIDNLISFLVSALFLWIIVAIFNPDIDSGLVWVIAYIYGTITSDMDAIERKIDGRK